MGRLSFLPAALISISLILTAGAFADNREALYQAALIKASAQTTYSTTQYSETLLAAFVDLQIEDFGRTGKGLSTLSVPAPSATPYYPALSPGSSAYAHWQRVQSFREELERKQSASAAERSVSMQENTEAFWSVILGYLQGAPAGESFDKLVAFAWTGGCGTGSDSLYRPKYLAEFSMLLASGEYAAAIGALINTERYASWNWGDEKAPNRLKAALLHFGESWEEIFLGLAAERSSTALRLLASEGGDIAAQGVLDLHPIYAADDYAIGNYAYAISKFVPSQCDSRFGSKNTFSTSEYRRISTVVTDPRLQNRLLEKLKEIGFAVKSSREAEDVADAYADICAPELVEPALRLAALPYTEPRQALSRFFLQHGVEPKGPALSAEVSVKVLLNGVPLANTELNWEARPICKKSDYCGGTSSGATTDANGVLRIKRDTLVPGGELVLTPYTYGKSGTKSFFEGRTKLAASIPDALTVEAQSGALELSLPPPPQHSDPKIRVTLTPKSPYRSEGGATFSLTLNLRKEHLFATKEPTVFSSLPPDDYGVCVSAPGWNLTCAEAVRIVAGKTAQVRIVPARGADITFQPIDRTTGAEARRVEWTLFEGERQSSRSSWEPRFSGLPLGQYRLRLKSHERFKEMGIRDESKVPEDLKPEIEKDRRFAPTEISFTIDESSPPVLDLGNIPMTPEGS